MTVNEKLKQLGINPDTADFEDILVALTKQGLVIKGRYTFDGVNYIECEPVALTKLDYGILIDAKEAGFEVTKQEPVAHDLTFFEKWLESLEPNNTGMGVHKINEYRNHMCKVSFYAGYDCRDEQTNEWKDYALKLREALIRNKQKEYKMLLDLPLPKD